ncbi:MAG: hypothetical protein ABJA69_06385 [Acidobacteriaceae bacterium]
MSATCHPDQLSHVILAAQSELHLLLQQRADIERRARIAIRTVKCLALVFGRDPQELIASDDSAGCVKSPSGLRARTYPHELETPDARVSSQQQSQMRFLSNDCKGKLERACRIALLESEQPATAGEVYDRIVRRQSYRLSPFKRPLVALAAALDGLVEAREVELCVRGNIRNWVWMGRRSEETK